MVDMRKPHQAKRIDTLNVVSIYSIGNMFCASTVKVTSGFYRVHLRDMQSHWKTIRVSSSMLRT